MSFAVAAPCLVYLAVLTGGPAWLLVWPAVDLMVLAIAYGSNRAALLGKRSDGTMNPLAVVALLPYFTLTWGVWHLFRRITPEPTSNEVAPGVHVGRRPYPDDLPADTSLVVDMTAEFPVAPGVKDRAEVLLLPTLDARAPAREPFEEATARVLAALEAGPVYIHCAAGHGRSATLAAAVLMTRGDAASADEAETLMRRSRPAVHLHSAQRRVLPLPEPARVG